MKVCKQTLKRVSPPLTAMSKTCGWLDDSYTSDPNGVEPYVCRKVRPPLGSWIGKALRPAHCIMCGYLKFDSRWGRWLVVILNLSKSSLF